MNLRHAWNRLRRQKPRVTVVTVHLDQGAVESLERLKAARIADKHFTVYRRPDDGRAPGPGAGSKGG